MVVYRTVSQWFLAASGITLVSGLAACGSSTPEANAPAADASPIAEAGETISLNGAGASFPAPLYQRWFAEYNEEYSNIQVSYQSVGSGAGIQQYLAGTVDFGASDAPLTEEERSKFRAKYNADPIQIPMTGGAVVFAYNLPGNVEGLKLSREAYCGIVTGQITSWAAPQIAEQNPGVSLPDLPITFVHRSDGSGTTFIFTNHIAEVCPGWTAGVGKSVTWTRGAGAKGNEGITAQVQQTEGAIGYVEYAYANETGLDMAALENKSGQYISPSSDTAANALEGQTIPANFALEIPDPTSAQAYPIVGLTWLLLYNDYDNIENAATLQNFVKWAFSEGDQYAKELGYVPLSDELAQKVQVVVNRELSTAS
ncbi:phosphate ABC transporter substrate-binding protein PstS [Phormidium tenue FACHB-886]|nr:phosphate ABC transporter substrate-binding protein PstS [Phormidium tenue FACHB-886]